VNPVTPVLLVHGGAGNPLGGKVDDEQAVHDALRDALVAGYELLAAGGGALDAAEAAVQWLEDCALFNAGRGSVLNAEGHVEMDAAVMDAGSREGHFGLSGMRERAAVVGGVLTVRSPADSGVEVDLRIPAARAYAKSSAARSWLAPKKAAPGETGDGGD